MVEELENLSLITKDNFSIKVTFWDDNELLLDIEDEDHYTAGTLSESEARKLYEALKKHYDND